MSLSAYSTRPNDTLRSIAAKFHVASQDYASFVSTVKRANKNLIKVDDSQVLPAGLKLEIPGSKDDYVTPTNKPVELNPATPATAQDTSVGDYTGATLNKLALPGTKLNSDGTMDVTSGSQVGGTPWNPNDSSSPTPQASVDPSFISRLHDAKGALGVAMSCVGKDASWLKENGLAGFMDPNCPNNECCANFVSACLEKAGLISGKEGSINVSGLGANLQATGRFHQVSLENAKPGDVVLLSIGHAVMYAGLDKNGQPSFIGSNNTNSDGSQRVGITGMFSGGITAIWEPN